jgi:MFS family permease
MNLERNSDDNDKKNQLDCLTIDSPEITEINNNFQNIQIKDTFEIIGEKGRFQYSVLFFFSICSLFVACVSFAMPFIYYEPQFYCNGPPNSTPSKCTQEEACKNPYGYYYSKSIRSVTVEFDLVCENKIKITRAQNVVVLVSGFGFYGFSFLSDIIGRKPIFFIAFALMMLGSVIVLIQNNFTFLVLGHTTIYFGKYAYISVMYTYCTETMAGELGKKAITITFILYGSGQIILSCISFSKPFYKVYFWLYLVLFFIVFCASIFIIETPFYKFKRRNLLEVYASLAKIAKTNSKTSNEFQQKKEKLNNFFKLPVDYVMKPDNNPKSKKKYSLINENDTSEKENKMNESSQDILESKEDLSHKLKSIKYIPKNESSSKFSKLFTREILKKIVLFCIVLSPIYFIFGEFFLIAQKIGLKNIGVNSIILGSIDVLSNLLVAFTIKNINPKKNHTLSCIGFTIFSFIIFLTDLIYKWSSTNKEKPIYILIIQTLLSVPMKVIVCFCFGTIFAYANKLFPTEIRAVGSGACMLYSRVLMSFTSYIVYFTDKFSFHPLAFSWILAVVAIPASLFCPNIKAEETNN